MICSICLALGRPLVGDVEHPEVQPAGGAITIANGQAVCNDHRAAVADWQTTDAGLLSILGLLDVLAPDTPPDEQ